MTRLTSTKAHAPLAAMVMTLAFAAGCALTGDFIKARPDVARRFAAVWKKAITFVNDNPQEARKYLAKNTLTPEDVVDTVPMVRW